MQTTPISPADVQPVEGDAYNLTVDGLHTYYAGESRILVHNTCDIGELGEAGDPASDMAQAARNLVAKKAGFSGRGDRVIVDENLPQSLGRELREAGFDARSVEEMGMQGAADTQISQVAEQADARVLTRDRGRQLDGGFGSRAVNVDRRVKSVASLLRLLKKT